MSSDRAHSNSYENKKVDADNFLLALGLEAGTDEAIVATAIRRVIADLAGVPEEKIDAHHSFSEDLSGLGSWDSLDTVEFLMRLEDLLGLRIPGSVAERFPGLSEVDRTDPFFLVSDMVLGIIFIMKSHGVD